MGNSCCGEEATKVQIYDQKTELQSMYAKTKRQKENKNIDRMSNGYSTTHQPIHKVYYSSTDNEYRPPAVDGQILKRGYKNFDPSAGEEVFTDRIGRQVIPNSPKREEPRPSKAPYTPVRRVSNNLLSIVQNAQEKLAFESIKGSDEHQAKPTLKKDSAPKKRRSTLRVSIKQSSGNLLERAMESPALKVLDKPQDRDDSDFDDNKSHIFEPKKKTNAFIRLHSGAIDLHSNSASEEKDDEELTPFEPVQIESHLAENLALKLPEDRLREILLEEINKARTDPLAFSYNIKDAEKILTRKRISIKDICDVKVLNGVRSFEKCIVELLCNDPMLPLQFKEDLCLVIPDDPAKWVKREYLSSVLNAVKKKTSYKHYFFHYDKGINNPLLSVVLQVVDDGIHKGARRKNILGQNMKYIGISVKVIKGEMCGYFLFAS